MSRLGVGPLIMTLLVSGCAAGDGADRGEDGAGCAVTEIGDQRGELPNRLMVESSTDRWYGSGDLWAAIPGRDWFALPQPGGGFGIKIGWWRLADGKIQLTADHLDGDGRAAGDVPAGYGASGFQATGVLFDQPGCWLVRGEMGDDVVDFVVMTAPAGSTTSANEAMELQLEGHAP